MNKPSKATFAAYVGAKGRRWPALLFAAAAAAFSPPPADTGRGTARGQGVPAVSPAGVDLGGLRGEVHELRLGLLKADALADELAEEERLLPPAIEGNLGARLTADSDFWKQSVSPGLTANGSVSRELEKQLESARVDESAAVGLWNEAVRADLEFRSRRDRAEEEAGRALDSPAGSWSVESLLAPVGLGSVAVLVGVLFTLHEDRRRIRWRLRDLGSRPGPAALLLAGSLALSGCGDRAAVDGPLAGVRARELKELTALRDSLRAELDGAETHNAESSRGLDARLARVRVARATFGFWPREADQVGRAEQALEEAEAAHNAYRGLRVASRTASAVRQAAVSLRATAAAGERSLAAFWAENRRAAVREGVARLSACGLMAASAFVPFLVVRGRARRRLEQESRLCPQCEALDTVRVPDDFEYEDEKPDEASVRIKTRKAVCGECDYEIREDYVRQNRLSVPTLGVYGSGKTHWMVVLYHLIKTANLPVASTLRKVPSRQDVVFDQILKQFLHDRIGSSATTRDNVRPIVFHVEDQDPLGRNRTTLNLFDVSGELSYTNVHADRDDRRLRLLRCQGFTFFLDPTQVVKGPWSRYDQTIEDQIDVLTHFSEELHSVRGVRPERPVDLPVAVCVPKIDMVLTQNPIGSQALPFVSELRETMGREINLELIHERSQICARSLPLLFPNWNIERALREQFGGRYMFFPLTPVGMDESEMGAADFKERSFSPFGVLEPLLWLLHMHGYCVLN